MIALATLPPFTGTTFDDLLADVEQRIIEEPLRLDMRWWVVALNGRSLGKVTPRGVPACGTVACLGGWMAIRSAIPSIYDGLIVGTMYVGTIWAVDWDDLFNSFVHGEEEVFHSAVKLEDPEYVPLVLRRLAAFRREHAESLKELLPGRSAS